MKNTRRRGQYRWIVFREGKEWIGAALEFNIVQVGNDPQVVLLELQDAVKGYLEAAHKITGFREKAISPILNQSADESYETLWDTAYTAAQKDGTPLPANIFDFGTRNLTVAA